MRTILGSLLVAAIAIGAISGCLPESAEDRKAKHRAFCAAHDKEFAYALAERAFCVDRDTRQVYYFKPNQ